MKAGRKKKFTAEVERERSRAHQILKRARTDGELSDAALVLHQQVLDTIEALRSDLTEGRASETALAKDFKREIEEGTELKHELDELSKAIADTKKEIAGVRRPGAKQDHIVSMTNQLDAIVGATEEATNTILAAAEVIDGHVEALRAQASGDEEFSRVDEVSNEVIKIFEACNFQDLTGQRITKVVNTLKFVEDRIETMMSILGGAAAFEGLEVPEDGLEDGDQALLQGPQLDGEGVSQDEIDSLFD